MVKWLNLTIRLYYQEKAMKKSLFSRIVIFGVWGFSHLAGSAENLQTYYIDGLPVFIDSTPIGLSTNDSYRKAYNQPLELDLLKNDKFTDINDINFSTPEHGQVKYDKQSGGITYTPNQGYYGYDSFSYQLVDNNGVKGNTAQVKIELVKGQALAPDITPFIANRRYYVDFKDEQLVTLTSSEDNVEIYYTINDLETGEGIARIRYTKPFYLYNTTRFVYWSEGVGYDKSDVKVMDFIFCKAGNDIGNCTRQAQAPSLKQFGWQPEKISVGDTAKLVWDVAEVQYCKQVFADGSESQNYAPQGEINFTATKAETIDSRWYCGRKKPPSPEVRIPASSNEYLVSTLTVDAMAIPTNLQASRTELPHQLQLSWDAVSNAARYEIQWSNASADAWSTLGADIDTNSFLLGTLSLHNQKFRVRACLSILCDNPTAWSQSLFVTLTSELIANKDEFVHSNASSNLDVLANDLIDPQFEIRVDITRQPQYGTVHVNSDLSITFTSSQNNSDFFEYQITEVNQGYQSNIARVSITPDFKVEGQVKWEPNDIVVGQTSTLTWDISAVEYCYDTEVPETQYKPNSKDEERTVKSELKYLPETITSNWKCLGYDGKTYPFSAQLKISKLAAPGNLTRQEQ